MKQKMIKKTELLLLFIFFAAANLFAQTSLSVDITSSMSVADIENKIQSAIAGTIPGDIVTVTGSKTNENASIGLNIPAEVSVAWNAVSKGLSFSIDGGGIFEVAEEGKIEVDGKNAINVDKGHVIISGGEVTAYRTYADYYEWRSAIYVKYGDVTMTDGKISAFNNAAAVEIVDGNLRMSGGELSVTDVDSQFGTAMGFCYTIRIGNYGTVAITGGKVIAEGSVSDGDYLAINFEKCGLAAYLAGTCIGGFDVYQYSAYGIIVEVDSLDIPPAYNGTNNGLTRKAGGNINEAWWDTSEETPYIHFEHNSWYDFSVPWKGQKAIVPPAEYPVRLRETNEMFKTLSEGIDAAKTQGYNTFTLEVIGDVTEISDVIIESEDITIIGAEGKHTFAFTNLSPPSGFKFSVQGGGSLTLGNGTIANTLTILHSVSVTNGTLNAKDGITVKSGGNTLHLSGVNATGTITGGRFEGRIALNIEKGATLSEISGGMFTGTTDAVHLSDAGTRIEKISGGAFYQKGAYAEIGMLHGHAVFVQNGSTIGEISGGYFEADPKANSAMVVIRGAWVDKISGGEFVASRPGTTREPSDDQWNSVIHVENRVSEGYSLTGIGTISGGRFYGGAHFGMLLITKDGGTSQVNEISGGFFEGIVGVQNDVGGYIGTISGGKLYGGQGILSVSTIDKITGDADIHGSSYGIYNYYTNSQIYGKINEISGGKITSDNSHGIQNSGVIGTISGGTITSIEGSSNGISNSSMNNTPKIDKITGGTITSEGFGNGIYNSGTINEISGGKIIGGMGTAGWYTGDTYGSGIYNSGLITLISGGTVIGYKNAINCVGFGDGGSIHTISNGVFWGQTKLAINLAKTMFLEPELDAVIGFGRYWGNDGVIFNNEDLVKYPGDYFMSTDTKPVGGIAEVEFKYLRLFVEPECIDSLVWTGAINKDWNNNGNWMNPDATVAEYAPRACTNVLIPKGLSIYPDLTPVSGTDYTQMYYETAACNNIWFEHGGEVVRTDSLHYTKAFIELTLEADRWNMLSAPLRYVFPGDFYKADPCPHADQLRIYQQLFAMQNPQTGEEDTSPTGGWTKSFNNPDVAMPAGFGYAISLQDKSDYPSESHWTPLPAGERHSIWLPKNDESYNIYYIASCDVYDTRPLARNYPDNYRFIYEGGDGWGSDNWTGDITLHTNDASEEGKQVIVGNPFMAHWDFNDFYLQNTGKIKEEYKVLDSDNDAAFTTYSPLLPSWDSNDKLIAPMQSILVTSLTNFGETDLKTHVASTTQNPGIILKSTSDMNPNLLKIVATKGDKQNHSYILFDESASNNYLLSKDSYKLFVTDVTGPVSVYTRSSDGYALDINVFGDYTQMIPIGIRTSQTGSISLQFEGIGNFLPKTDLFLLDTQTGTKINLRETSEYNFDKTTGDLFLDGRFFLSINKVANSDLSPVQDAISIFTTGNQLQVISSSLIKEVHIFDIQGRMIEKAINMKNSVYTHDLPSNSMYVVKVLTEGGMTVKKITTAN